LWQSARLLPGRPTEPTEKPSRIKESKQNKDAGGKSRNVFDKPIPAAEYPTPNYRNSTENQGNVVIHIQFAVAIGFLGSFICHVLTCAKKGPPVNTFLMRSNGEVKSGGLYRQAKKGASVGVVPGLSATVKPRNLRVLPEWSDNRT
jgi:hypothetical protein